MEWKDPSQMGVEDCASGFTKYDLNSKFNECSVVVVVRWRPKWAEMDMHAYCLIQTNLGRSTCHDLENANWIDPLPRPTPIPVELCNQRQRSSYKQAEIPKVKNQVMYIRRIGWAVRLVSKFRTVRCGETHQMMYEIVDLSILQHFWVIHKLKAVGFMYPDWISPSKDSERSLLNSCQQGIRGPRNSCSFSINARGWHQWFGTL